MNDSNVVFKKNRIEKYNRYKDLIETHAMKYHIYLVLLFHRDHYLLLLCASRTGGLLWFIKQWALMDLIN